MFDLIVHIKANSPSDHPQIKHHLGEMAKLCPKEPGCISWKTFAESEDKGSFFILESWQSKTHWQDHMSYATFVTHYENGMLPLIQRDVYFVESLG